MITAVRRHGTLRRNCVGERVNDLRVKLGNDLTVKAYREGTPFPDGAIIAQLTYNEVSSDSTSRFQPIRLRSLKSLGG